MLRKMQNNLFGHQALFLDAIAPTPVSQWVSEWVIDSFISELCKLVLIYICHRYIFPCHIIARDYKKGGVQKFRCEGVPSAVTKGELKLVKRSNVKLSCCWKARKWPKYWGHWDIGTRKDQGAGKLFIILLLRGFDHSKDKMSSRQLLLDLSSKSWSW